jgi:hypothetical protein
MSETLSVLWLTLGGREVASSRVRAFRISDALEREGVRSRCVVATGVRGRLAALVRVAFFGKANVIVVQKLLLRSLVLQLLRRRTEVLVWECDDALNLGYPGSKPREVAKEQRRVEATLARVDVVTTSNPLLAKELRPVSGRISTLLGPAPSRQITSAARERLVIWIGSSSTEAYLSLMRDAPIRLRNAGWECVALGASMAAARLGWRRVEWSLAAEKEWLSRAIVGVMPQPSDPWAERKQGYKLYEYMAHGVVPVASDVLPARMVMQSARLRPLLVVDNTDWLTAIETAASLRRELLPCLGESVARQSVESAVRVWTRAVGLGGTL